MAQSTSFQPPARLEKAIIQPLPVQPAFFMQPMLMVPLRMKSRTSGAAVTSLVVGIVDIILALFDLIIINVWGMASVPSDNFQRSTTLGVLLIFAVICWIPALIAFSFGLLGKDKIGRDGGQTTGLGLAHAGIILSAIGFALPLLGILLYLITLIP
jgi:hypothetical protein